jgi:hypothetical protein
MKYYPLDPTPLPPLPPPPSPFSCFSVVPKNGWHRFAKTHYSNGHYGFSEKAANRKKIPPKKIKKASSMGSRILRKRHTPATVGRYLPTYLETLLNSPSKRFTLLLLSLACSLVARALLALLSFFVRLSHICVFSSDFLLSSSTYVIAHRFCILFCFISFFWLIAFGQVPLKTRCSIRCSGNDDACCNHAEYRLCNTSGIYPSIYLPPVAELL